MFISVLFGTLESELGLEGFLRTSESESAVVVGGVLYGWAVRDNDTPYGVRVLVMVVVVVIVTVLVVFCKEGRCVTTMRVLVFMFCAVVVVVVVVCRIGFSLVS